MRALALALLVAASPDGGVRAYDVARANLDLVDGRSVGVDGGCWLRDDACAGRQRPAGCRGAHSAWPDCGRVRRRRAHWGGVDGAGRGGARVRAEMKLTELQAGVRELGRPPRRGLEACLTYWSSRLMLHM